MAGQSNSCASPKFSIYFHFQGEILLTVESNIEYSHDNTRDIYLTSQQSAQSGLVRLLDSSVTSAVLSADRGLLLTFSNGDSIVVDFQPGYESYRLRVDSKELIA